MCIRLVVSLQYMLLNISVHFLQVEEWGGHSPDLQTKMRCTWDKVGSSRMQCHKTARVWAGTVVLPDPCTTLTLTWVASFSGSCFPSFYHLQYGKEPMRAWCVSVWEWGYTCYSLILRLVGNYCQTVMVPGIGGMIPYCGKLSEEKTFANFKIHVFAKVFCAKFGGVASFGSTREQSVKVYFPPSCESFLSRKFPATQWVTVERRV